MGNFYTNVTLRGPDEAAVVEAVKAAGYLAYISPTVSGYTMVCEERSDEQDEDVWNEVPRRLSQELQCPALAVLNHDDDIFSYVLYRNGELLDEYNSLPDYWDDTDDPVPPEGGNPAVLCEHFGMPGVVSEVERVLRSTDDELALAMERHWALVRALQWPPLQFQQGYQYIAEDENAENWQKVEPPE